MPTILAIDDKHDNLIVIQALIKHLLPDAAVFIAQTGQKGLELARKELPDVILLDLVMPGMDGYVVCTALRADDATQHIPIIMLTAVKTDSQSRIKALEAGADAFLTKPLDETELVAQVKAMLRIKHADEMARDIAERKRTEEQLRQALQDVTARQAEVTALLRASRAVLEYHEFQEAAHEVFDACKDLIGATSGYVALLTPEGTENEVLFLDAGGRPCTVDPALPMPIRGLRAEAYRTGTVVYENHFARSEWMRYMPEGHVSLDNVLFAPLNIHGKAVGLLGLANKPADFTDHDAQMTSAFGELAAIALRNSRSLELLEISEERFRAVVQTATDAIITANTSGCIISWNRAAETMFGYAENDVIGKSLTHIMPRRFRKAHISGMRRIVTTGRSRVIGSQLELMGLRKDQTEFPIELSLAEWKTAEGIFFTGIIRDITERKNAELALQESKQSLEEMIYIASHDLQAPLVSMGGYATELLETYRAKLDTNGIYCLQRLQVNARRMHALVLSLLDISRLNTQKNPYISFNPQDVLAELRHDLALVIEQAQAQVTITTMPPIYGDRQRIAGVFRNLLTNALNYGGKQVTIGYARDAYYVRDDGIGIPEGQFENIFKPGERLKLTNAEGSGMGLTFCKKVITQHKGAIWVESEGTGKGSTFCFTLPNSQSE